MNTNLPAGTASAKSSQRKRLRRKEESRNLKKKRILVDDVDAGGSGAVSNSGAFQQHSYTETDSSASDPEDLLEEDTNKYLDFDIEAFPMEPNDRDGVINMLTQVFLKANIDLGGLADAIIAQSPFGLVIGPAEDQCDEDNVVYGILSIVPLSPSETNQPKYVQDILRFIQENSRKLAMKSFRDVFQAFRSCRIGLFVNERLLNFPSQIVTPSFRSIETDLSMLKKSYEWIIYVHKLRIAEQEAVSTKRADEKHGEKKKIGKAKKKKCIMHGLSSTDIIFDNIEDGILYQLHEGEAEFFDYPVHNEVEASSKFHILRKNGKSYKPYRRVVIMDNQRFKAFIEQVIKTNL